MPTLPGPPDVSDGWLAKLDTFEGKSLVAFRDSGGVWTIGYGHTGPDVHEGMTITEEEAVLLRRADLMSAMRTVNDTAPHALTQWEYDALVDFCYNAGAEAYTEHLLPLLRKGDRWALLSDMAEYIADDRGTVLRGLVRRRTAEILWSLGVHL